MREAHHFTASAKRKGSYALPSEFDGVVNRAALYHAVRAFRNNQRHGTHSTKTRGEVSGGSRKPWRQKGTGRARQGTIRAPHWPGGGIVFGPRPRGYRTALPRKVRQLARQSALNARANEDAFYVIEALDFEAPRTKQMVELLRQLELGDQKVLVLTSETRPTVYLSGRNLGNVHVMRYADATAYDILWSDAVLAEEGAVGGHAISRRTKSTARRSTRAKETAEAGTKKAAGRALAKKRTTAKKTGTKTKATKAPKSSTSRSPRKKSGG